MMRLKRGFLVLAAAAMVAAVMTGCPGGGGGGEPTPDFRITLDRQGTQELGSAYHGYQADDLTPLVVTVTNEGARATGQLGIDLGGSAAFAVSPATMESMEPGSAGQFTVTPVTGLGLGNHIAIVTVSGDNDISASFVASFTVNFDGPARGITLEGVDGSHVFPSLAEGYGAHALRPLNVVVANIGSEPTGDLTVAVSGDDFEATVSTISSLAVGARGNFNVSPIMDLTEGEYSATVTVSGTAAGLDPISFEVSLRVNVPSLISMASGGTGVSFAVLADGTLWSWGNNTNGRAGTGIAGNVQATPAPVYGGLEGWVHVSSRTAHTLAIREVAGGRHLYAWGSSENGRLGIAGAVGNVPRPTRVGTDTDWLDVSAGGSFSVGIKTDGTLWFWGNRLYGGWAGTDDDDERITDDVPTPIRLGNLDGWVAVSAGANAVGAIRQVGTGRHLYMWGSNADGELGPGILPIADGTVGFEIIGPTEPVRLGNGTNWESISIGNQFALAIRSVGTERHLYSWGRSGFLQWPTQPPPDWANEDLFGDGRLGRPVTTVLDATPTRVGTYTDWHSVSAGNLFGVGLRGTPGDLRLMGWGSNQQGRAGQGIDSNTVRTLAPTQIGTYTDWTFAAASGNNHGLGIRSSQLFGWGSNSDQQLAVPGGGLHTRPVPIAVP